MPSTCAWARISSRVRSTPLHAYSKPSTRWRASVPESAPAPFALRGPLRDSWGAVVGLALLDFAWFMLLPVTVAFFLNDLAAAAIPVLAGAVVETTRMLARQQVRRTLRGAFMIDAAKRALAKEADIAEVRS